MPSYPTSNEVRELGGRSFQPRSATPHNRGHRIIGDAGEDGHDHPPRRACRIRPWLIKRL